MIKMYRTLSRKVGSEKVKDYVVRFRKISIQGLRTGLNKGKDFTLAYLINEKGIKYEMIVRFWRLDIIPELKKKYKKQTYVLGIEKGDARWQIDHENLVIDERHEFHTVEEIVDYLDKKDYLKKKDWIKEEAAMNNKTKESDAHKNG